MKKGIGLWSAVSIGVGGMIGAGIFSILGVATQIAGNAVYLSFIIAGFVALLSTYSYAKLGARYPSAGGPVEFLIKGFGGGVFSGGFNILLWIGYIFALSLYARAFASYAMTFLPAGSSGLWLYIFATGIVVLFTIVNFVGAKAVGSSETLIVAIKVGILLLFALIGLFFINPSHLSPSLWPLGSNILFGAGIVFLGYEGFGLITNAAEDMDNPGKTLPRALYLSVFITMIIYVLVSVVVVGSLKIPSILAAKDYALAEAARPFLGLIGFKLMALAALFSTASAINATLYGGANVSYTIAKDGGLPKVFDRKLWGKSTEGLFITSGLVILLANFLDLGGIAMIGSAAFLLIYAAVNLAHMNLYKQTGANVYIIILAAFSCLVALGILIYYTAVYSQMTLIVLLMIITATFVGEWAYRKYSLRVLRARYVKG
ncbi:MAG: amino acid permease [Candidatus Diapherotrites archaeon]|nr:amino acid permease [Candidatus Diapherotrites archaeon]